MAVTRVLLVRHGQSEANVARIWTSDVPGHRLTPLGHEQAREFGASLVHRGVTAIYSSTLLRAQETATEIADVLGLERGVLDGLGEFHVGVHEGIHDDEVGPIAEDVFRRWWHEDDIDHRFEGGESARDVADRMQAALDRAADQHPDETIVVVSHGGAMITAVGEMCRIDGHFIPDHVLHNLGLLELVRDDGVWRCERWDGIVPPTRTA